MNLNSMEYFIALVEERSFTRAAERLNITQQTLSAHVAGLERELRVRLVNRKVPLTLTYAGEVLLRYARRIDTDHRALVQEFADIAGDTQGLLRVGIGSTRGRLLMPQTIASFRATKPGVRVEVVEEENDEIVESLREGRIDLAVATVPQSTAGLEVSLLRTEQIVLLVSWELLCSLYGNDAGKVVDKARHAQSLAPLKELPFLLLGRHDEPGGLSRRIIESAGLNAEPVILSSNSETLVELALLNMGATFVPEDLARRMLEERQATSHVPQRGMCVINLGPAAQIDIHLAWRSSDHVWSVIEDFAEQLRRLADA